MYRLLLILTLAITATVGTLLSSTPTVNIARIRKTAPGRVDRMWLGSG